MHAGEQSQGGDGSDHAQEHVPLRVPDIALGAQERGGAFAGEQGDPPLDELVEGAQGKADRDHDEVQPGGAALRFVITALHEPSDIDTLLHALDATWAMV